jgi:hypothetical protein
MFTVVLRYYKSIYTLLKKLSKIEKKFEKMSDSSYTYRRIRKLMSVGKEFNGEP